MGGCMGQWVGSGQMTNLIKLELINIIWFCLKIYNLLRHPYLWVDGWVNEWAHVKPLKSNKPWPNWDNSIMDILDILLDILLKPPQPFIGLFSCLCGWTADCYVDCRRPLLKTCCIFPTKNLHFLCSSSMPITWHRFWSILNVLINECPLPVWRKWLTKSTWFIISLCKNL